MRELQSVLRALVALADHGDVITQQQISQHLQISGTSAATPVSEPTIQASARLVDVENDAFDQALAACANSVTDAAQRLGVHRSTVYRHLARRRSDKGRPSAQPRLG